MKGKQGDVRMNEGNERRGVRFVIGTLVMTFLLLSLASSACADMSITEANKTCSVRFRDWVYVYVNNEFIQAAPSAPDYTIAMRPKIIDNKIRFVITGYYFDTKLGIDWYRRYASQLDSIIAMMCHTWTQQGHQISLDDFEINIHKEKVDGSSVH